MRQIIDAATPRFELRGRSLGGTALALAGGWLAYRALKARGRSRSDDAAAGPDSERREAAEAPTPSGGTTVEESVTVGAPAEELHRLWRDPDQLARIVGPFAEVVPVGGDRHRWTADAPLGRTLEWETALVEDRPGELLRWRSTEGVAVFDELSVRFRPAPADRGTQVTLALRFDPPGGRVGSAAMELLGAVPDALADVALDRFKSLAETGEIPTLERNPSARGSGDLA